MLIRRLVFVLLFLLAQAGALAHGIGHFSDGHDHDGTDHEPVCELCLAFAPMGAGMAGVAADWSPPVPAQFAEGVVPELSLSRFPPSYRSRGPPGLNR